MFGKVVSAACLAAIFGASPALADLKGPAELPPPGFKGQQYVDSRGCVFLRAGYGGQVTWVPRVTAKRKQLCGYPASGGTVEVAETAAPAPEPAPAPAAAPEVAPTVTVAAAPKVEVKPKATVVSAPPVAATPAPAPAPAKRTVPEVRGEAVASAGAASGFRLACPAETPVAQRFEIRGGGSTVMCTTGDGTLDGANFPRLVEGSLDGYPSGYDAWVAAGSGATATARATAKVTEASKSAKLPPAEPPKGYKLAWKDGRLNPNRGKQTVDGVLDQDEIWTRTTPAELREDWGRPKAPLTIIVRHADGSTSAHEGIVVSTKSDGKRVVRITGPVTKSSKSEPKAEPAAKATAGGRLMVQVGSFGVPANAEGAAGRLKALGLPVARGKAQGGALTVVYAGPFASASEAKAALALARRAGFGDAVIRQ